jgi:hypothetical protein
MADDKLSCWGWPLLPIVSFYSSGFIGQAPTSRDYERRWELWMCTVLSVILLERFYWTSADKSRLRVVDVYRAECHSTRAVLLDKRLVETTRDSGSC